MDGERLFAREDIEAAERAGVLTPGQGITLLAFLEARLAAAPGRADEESIRFVTSFNDIFVTLGIALFLGPVLYFFWQQSPFILGAVLAGSAWGLAEIFTRRRRMAFPSIVLLVIFTIGCFVALGGLFGAIDPATQTDRETGLRVAGAALATAALVGVHWARFHVPITVAAGVAAGCVTVVALVAALLPEPALRLVNAIILFLGLGVFALAMRFDMADTARRTRKTDVAFWLHLLAAPMIVHPVIALVVGGSGFGLLSLFGVGGDVAPVEGAPFVTLAVLVALAFIAIVVDRRALLVSGLSYAGFALGRLMESAGFKDDGGAATILMLGATVLLLSAAWRPVRALVLTPLPPGVKQRVPPAG